MLLALVSHATSLSEEARSRAKGSKQLHRDVKSFSDTLNTSSALVIGITYQKHLSAQQLTAKTRFFFCFLLFTRFNKFERFVKCKTNIN